MKETRQYHRLKMHKRLLLQILMRPDCDWRNLLEDENGKPFVPPGVKDLSGMIRWVREEGPDTY